MGAYLEIALEDRIYTQRTPTSKFIEFSLDGTKLNTYEELPEEIQHLAKKMTYMEEHPELHFEYENIDGGIKITRLYDSVGSHVKIPEFIDGKPVIALGSYIIPYALQDEIKQIQLPETIEELDKGCFESGKALRFLNLPKKVTILPDECFKNCSLTYIDFSNIKKIGHNVCRDCWVLRTADLSSVVEIGEYAFTQCQNLRAVTLSSDLKVLKEGTFRRCNFLEEIKLPESLERLDDGVFEDCFKLKKVNFPESITHIDNYCFYRCVEIEEFIAPSNLSFIGEYAFSKSGVKKVHLNPRLNKVEGCAFSNCEKLEEVRLYNPTAYLMRPFDLRDVNKIKVINPLGKLIGIKIPEKGVDR